MSAKQFVVPFLFAILLLYIGVGIGTSYPFEKMKIPTCFGEKGLRIILDDQLYILKKGEGSILCQVPDDHVIQDLGPEYPGPGQTYLCQGGNKCESSIFLYCAYS